MEDSEIRLLLRKNPIAFLDGENFATQTYHDTEIGVHIHVHIPTNGFPATEYGDAEVVYCWRGEDFSEPEALRLCLIRDPEIRAIMETRETIYRERETANAKDSHQA
jgi:hypothetical protein